MIKTIIIGVGVILLTSCSHIGGSCEGQKGPAAQPIFRADVAVWIDYFNSVDGMPAKDLKNEFDRLRHITDRSWDDELRLALSGSLQAQKARNYPRALELLSQAIAKIQANTDLRAWLKMQSQQVAVMVQLDKEWSDEKRQRLELEKKLKALSDIERDISERSKNSEKVRP